MPRTPLPCSLALVLALLGCLFLAASAEACPFCSMQGKTLTDEVTQAPMVLFGTLANAKVNAKGGFDDGTTDLNIEKVIKKHEILGDKKVLSLPRYLPPPNKTDKFLVFCDVYKGKIDPYALRQVKSDSDMVKYVEGALAVKNKDIASRLKYFFDYLDNKDIEISNDAYKEYANVDYKDYKDVANKLPPHKIAQWLEDPETPSFRIGLYASMLGHCGTAKHADLLHKLLDDKQKRLTSGVDCVLAGYIMLKPKDGWEYTRAILKDSSKEFPLRYAALRAARFFWDNRSDVVEKKDIIEGIGYLLDQNDIADFAIEDFRKWGRWEKTEQVLGLFDKESHNVPIVRRAIVRFALSCPADQTKAAAFIKDLRQKDPDLVKDTEELLKLETGLGNNGKSAAKK